MLETVEQTTRPRVAWSVIWLHGLGADGHDFAPIVPELVRDDWPGIRFVFPHAPVRPVTLNGGMPMRAWYDLKSLGVEDRADEPGLREVLRVLALASVCQHLRLRGPPDDLRHEVVARRGLLADLRERVLAELEEHHVCAVTQHEELGVVVPHLREKVEAPVEVLPHVVVLGHAD